MPKKKRDSTIVYLESKKGQFFLVTALIFMLIIFTLVVRYNDIHELGGLEHFEDLSANFNKEAPKVINNALLEDKEPEKELGDFSSSFQEYASTQDPNFGVAYVYVNPDTGVITISNILAGRQIKIVATDSNGKPIKIDGELIFSKNEETKGSVCLQGFGNAACSKASTSIGSWGEGLTKTEIENKEINKLYLNVEGESVPIEISQLLTNEEQIDKDRLAIYVRSDEYSNDGSKKITTTLCPPPPGINNPLC